MKTIKLSRKGIITDINKNDKIESKNNNKQNEKFKHLISSMNFNDTRETKNDKH